MGDNNNIKLPWVAYIFAALFVGAGVGYWYGNISGKEQGRALVLEEQRIAQEEALRKAQEEIVKAANPFEATNPLENAYQNPFKANVNPFAE